MDVPGMLRVDDVNHVGEICTKPETKPPKPLPACSRERGLLALLEWPRDPESTAGLGRGGGVGGFWGGVRTALLLVPQVGGEGDEVAAGPGAHQRDGRAVVALRPLLPFAHVRQIHRCSRSDKERPGGLGKGEGVARMPPGAAPRMRHSARTPRAARAAPRSFRHCRGQPRQRSSVPVGNLHKELPRSPTVRRMAK